MVSNISTGKNNKTTTTTTTFTHDEEDTEFRSLLSNNSSSSSSIAVVLKEHSAAGTKYSSSSNNSSNNSNNNKVHHHHHHHHHHLGNHNAERNKTKPPLSALATCSSRIIRLRFVFMVAAALILIDFLTVEWIPTIFMSVTNRRSASITTTKAGTTATTKTTTATATATSGTAFHLTKIRSYDTKKSQQQQLRFQSASNLIAPAAHEQDELGYWPQGAFWNRPDCKNWGAATTIFPPTAAVEQFVALDGGWCLVVAGDMKGPTSYNVNDQYADKLVFLSRERQEELAEHLAFVKKTPWNHFARKNVAYLYAIANGAQYIWDFDDDNILFPNETLSRYTNNVGSTTTSVIAIDTHNNTECSVFNPYPFFRSSEQGVWPRGYPLDKINAPECQLSSRYCTVNVSSDDIGIYQSLADKDPDVDAVYRLTRPLPITFAGADDDRPVLVPPHTLSPMNAQATLYSRMGMWSMFLPTTVHGRVSDIWRSYIAQAVGKTCGMMVSFVGPHVVQDRNAHNYLADMEAERQLYERSGSLISYLLKEWSYDDLEATLEGAWERMFVDLYERGIVEQQDVELAQLWISSLQAVGYQFPAVLEPTTDGFNQTEQRKDVTWCKEWTTSSLDKANPIPFQEDEGKLILNKVGHKGSKSAVIQNKQEKVAVKRICDVDDVVLVGQFNFNMKARTVLHWVKKWKSVFRRVEVRGPFNPAVISTLRGAGVDVFHAAADKGWYSPIQNLADSLRLHANDTNICGVVTAHDDLLMNISHLESLGFPSDDTIVSEIPEYKLLQPLFTIYPNATLSFHKDGTVALIDSSKATFSPLWKWREFLPTIIRALAGAAAAAAAAAVPGGDVFIRPDGGMDIYQYGQSDFAYVPTSMAEPFALYAEWMVKNEIFLEVALPAIVATLKHEFKAQHQTAVLCSEWNYNIRGNVGAWLPACITSGTFGVFHPVKLSKIGNAQWDSYFDKIVSFD